MDSCDKANGCVHKSLTDGSNCSAELPCALSAACKSGKCEAVGWRILDKVVSTASGDGGRGVIWLPNGGNVMVGSSLVGIGAGKADILVTRVSTSGDIAWKKTIGTADEEKGYDLALLDGGDFVVLGSVKSGSKPDVLILRMGPDGAIKWKSKYGGAGTETPGAILGVPGVGLVFVGRAPDKFSGSTGCLMVRMTAGGKVVWSKVGGDIANNYCVAVAKWGASYVMAGTTYQNEGPQGLIVSIGGDTGSNQWTRRVFDGPLTGITLQSNGVLVVSGTTAKGDIYLAAYPWNPNAGALWKSIHGTSTDDSALGMALRDGTPLVFGRLAKTPTLLSVGNGGAVQWAVALPGVTDSNLDGMAIGSDSRVAIAFVGAAVGYADPVLRLIRTDPWGNATCAASGPCAAKKLADCADNNPCTADLCDAAHKGCWHKNLADGAPCGGGKTCKASKCQ